MYAAPESPVLYIRFRKKVAIQKDRPVYLGQLAELMAADPGLEAKLASLIMIRPEEEDGNLLLVDMMQVVRKAREVEPALRIEHFGEPHVLIEVVTTEKKIHPVPLVLVWLLLFIGSGLAIMNFHEDVSMPEVHRRIYELLTGKRPEHPYILQIPYSVGLGLGMVLFFNRLFKRKFNEEPSPLEVEMYLYQENLNQYVVSEEYAKLHPGRDKNDTGPMDV